VRAQLGRQHRTTVDELISNFFPQPSIKKEVTQYMEPGHWFVSLYNDDGDPHEVSFIAVIAEDMTHNCPNGCSGKGECLLGHCQCNPGFGGEDCSESVCPVLCSQRGEFHRPGPVRACAHRSKINQCNRLLSVSIQARYWVLK